MRKLFGQWLGKSSRGDFKLSKYSRVVSNTVMLYILSIVRMVLPLVSLPYLTRVLSEDAYGLVAYVKSCMSYITILIDFGFILSSVKDIVKADGDLKQIGCITGNTLFLKFVLSLISAVIMLVMCLSIGILKINTGFVWLYFLSIVLGSFLADFLFRGIEKMHYITIIYMITKSISTVLTFVFVKNDQTMMWIPILEIIANCVALVITYSIVIGKLHIRIRISSLKKCFNMFKESFVYFLSNVATTSFSALITLLIGIYISDLKIVAYWSLCMSIISTIQGLYSPICNSIYPYMIKEKSLSFFHKVMLIFMPLVTLGCVISYFCAELGMYLLGGEKYIVAADLFRMLIPVLLFSFLAQMYGWPTLGAIDKEKQATDTTIISVLVQIVGIVILIACNQFNIIMIAILRVFTEFVLMLTRIIETYKYRNCFVKVADRSKKQ